MTEKKTTAQKSIAERFYDAYDAVENPPKNGWNPHYKSNFSELRDILGAIDKACAERGIQYQQLLFITEDGHERVKSFVFDRNGDALELSVFPLLCPNDIQKFGSNITYTRRYQALTDWGIVGEIDDDGNGSSLGLPPNNPDNDAPDKADKEVQEIRRKRYLDKIEQLQNEALSLGIKPEGINSWVDVTFQKPYSNLNADELIQLGNYINTLISDKKELNGSGNGNTKRS